MVPPVAMASEPSTSPMLGIFLCMSMVVPLVLEGDSGVSLQQSSPFSSESRPLCLLGVGILSTDALLLECLLLEARGWGSQEPFRSRQEGGWRTRDRDALLDSARNTLEAG